VDERLCSWQSWERSGGGDMAEANAQKIAAYCKKHPDATLASAIKAVAKL